MFHQTEEFLIREKTLKQNYERELFRLKNNMDKLMKSPLPMQMRIKLMESLRFISLSFHS